MSLQSQRIELVLRYMKDGLSRSQACERASVDYKSEFLRWYDGDMELRQQVALIERNRKKAKETTVAGSAEAAQAPAANDTVGGLPKQLVQIGFPEFLESDDYCGLELSPAVRAVALASEGRGDEIKDVDLAVRLFGVPPDGLPRERPRTVVTRTGGQCGKTSRLGAPRRVFDAWTVPAPNLLPRQRARSLITAARDDLAIAAIDYCKGFIAGSPILKKAVVDVKGERIDVDDEEDDVGTLRRILIRRPDGHVVEIQVKAASKGGTGGRSRTLLGALLDEWEFCESEGAVTDIEVFRAVTFRVVPGAQVWMMSTPWILGKGQMEELIEDETRGIKYDGREWGKPWDDTRTALIVCPDGPRGKPFSDATRLFHPTWDPDRVIEKTLRKDPDNAFRELDNVPFTGGASGFFDPLHIARAITSTIPTDAKRLKRGAGIDAAFVSNSSAQAIVNRFEGQLYSLAALDEIIPQRDNPTEPSIACISFADKLERNGLKTIAGDGHYKVSMMSHFSGPFVRCPACEKVKSMRRDGAEDRKWIGEATVCENDKLSKGCGLVWEIETTFSIAFIAAGEPEKMFLAVRELFREGRIFLGNLQDPIRSRLEAQLKSVVGKPRTGNHGGIQILIPQTRTQGAKGGMAHGDLVTALVVAAWEAGAGRHAAGGLPSSGGTSRYGGRQFGAFRR